MSIKMDLRDRNGSSKLWPAAALWVVFVLLCVLMFLGGYEMGFDNGAERSLLPTCDSAHAGDLRDDEGREVESPEAAKYVCEDDTWWEAHR